MRLSKDKIIKLIFLKDISKIYNILNKKVKNKTITKNSKTPFFIKYIIKGYEFYILIISKYLIDLFSDNDAGTVNKIIYKEKPSLNISEIKNLFGKVIIITPNISKKIKLMNLKEIKKKPKITLKIKKKDVNKLINKKGIDKIHKTKNNFKVFKKEKPKEKNKVKNKSFEKVKMAYLNKPKKKYKLQKKKKAPIAIFSTSIAAIFFTISLALISFKKLIHGMFVISPAAFLRKQTLKKQSKRLVKK